MSSRRRPPSPPPLEIRRFAPEQAERVIKLLDARIAEVRSLDPKTVRYDDERVRTAERKIRTTVLEVFGENSPEYQDYRYHEIRGGGTRVVMGSGDDPYAREAESQRDFAAGIPRTITMLEGLIDTVKERTDEARPALGEVIEEARPTATDEVFIVHGRKEGPRETVARFLTKLGFKPIILQEQASEGRTIIEKFERHSNVGYAVVLLTAEDRGGLDEADPATYASRARQNVILELGYFVGKLGRRRVCVFYEEGVEVPSDFHGVVYASLDAGGAWKLLLAREMKAAALDVDLNLAI